MKFTGEDFLVALSRSLSEERDDFRLCYLFPCHIKREVGCLQQVR
jgi:hypothetical protein